MKNPRDKFFEESKKYSRLKSGVDVAEYEKKKISEYRARNPLKNEAHKKVYVALRNGTIKKQKCFCGSEKTEAHHTDYALPLHVIWLCKKHHVIADRERRLTEGK